MKYLLSGILAVFLVLITAQSSYAHVVVKPAQVGVGERVNFAVSVPNEEDTPTVKLRLLIPNGLQSVRPNAKPGWNIELKKTASGDITEIIWSGGTIPVDLRDEFIFSAQAPATATTLVWKAYQTYGDGDTVAWDNDPKMVEKQSTMKSADGDDHNAPRPYSETNVMNDLTSSGEKNTISPNSAPPMVKESKDNTALVLGIVGTLSSVVALALHFRKK